MEQKRRRDRQGVIVKGKESANQCELEKEMGEQKLCVCVCACAGKETVVLLSPEQAALRLSKFPLANNNSTQVPVEARFRTTTRPAQYEGV